jgi:hypothetical protein
MKIIKGIILAAIMVAMLTSCHKMTKREAVNFNDNVIFCIQEIEKYQGRAGSINPQEVLAIEDIENGYEKVIEKSKGYKTELKDVFKSYKHPACKKLKKAFYVYVDEQVKLTEDYQPQISETYKTYLSNIEENDSVATAQAFNQFINLAKKYEEDSKPIIEKFFSAHDTYVAETGIKLR